eukprot:gene13234-9480_t
MAIDPKIKNLIKFFLTRFILPIAGVVVVLRFWGATDYFRLLGQATLLVLGVKYGVAFYRRVLTPAKKPLEFGKWAIVTGSTSGIGKDFADHLAKQGMNVLVISRTKSRLEEQVKSISTTYNVKADYLAYDFTLKGQERDDFYKALDEKCAVLDKDGGIGLLINNVGAANEIPKNITEFTDQEVDEMLQCNIYSTVYMTRAVFKYMKEKKNGGIVSISSGSGNAPTPYLAVYSATKAFITQFSRSLKVEWWDSGVDFLVVTPYYVVSNLYKRKSGTLLAPMPIELIKGTLAQLGKREIWEGHGYWMHGVLGFVGQVYWGSVPRVKKMMEDNRKRFDEKMAAKSSAKKQE